MMKQATGTDWKRQRRSDNLEGTKHGVTLIMGFRRQDTLIVYI